MPGKARCKLGLECPFQHEHQHTAEFSHSAEPSRKRKSTAVTGSAPFKGRGKKVGRIAASVPKPRRRQTPTSRPRGAKIVGGGSAIEKQERESPRSAAAKAALQRAERLKQAKLLKLAAELRSQMESSAARAQRRDRRTLRNDRPAHSPAGARALTKHDTGRPASTQSPSASSSRSHSSTDECRVSDALGLIDLSSSPKVAAKTRRGRCETLAEPAVVDLSHVI